MGFQEDCQKLYDNMTNKVTNQFEFLSFFKMGMLGEKFEPIENTMDEDHAKTIKDSLTKNEKEVFFRADPYLAPEYARRKLEKLLDKKIKDWYGYIDPQGQTQIGTHSFYQILKILKDQPTLNILPDHIIKGLIISKHKIIHDFVKQHEDLFRARYKQIKRPVKTPSPPPATSESATRIDTPPSTDGSTLKK